jgi:hypothetical protein
LNNLLPRSADSYNGNRRFLLRLKRVGDDDRRRPLQKTARYAGGIRCLSKSNTFLDIMTNVQAVKKEGKVLLHGEQFSTQQVGMQV